MKFSTGSRNRRLKNQKEGGGKTPLTFIRTIGLARAEAKLTLAKIAYNFNRLIFHERIKAMG